MVGSDCIWHCRFKREVAVFEVNLVTKLTKVSKIAPNRFFCLINLVTAI